MLGKILSSAILLPLTWGGSSPAAAQTSEAAINQTISTGLPSCGNNCITASDLRSVLLSMSAAIFQAQGTSGLALSGTAAAGYVPIATSPTAVAWSLPAFTAPVTSGSTQNYALNLTSSGLSGGFNIQQTGAGTSTGLSLPPTFNNVLIQENLNDGSGFVTGLGIVHVIEGAGSFGGREAFSSTVQRNTAASGSNTNNQDVGVTGQCLENVNNNGTSGASVGACFGGGFVFVLGNGATYYSNATAAEFNSAAQTGSSVKLKSIIQINGRNDDAVAGSSLDTMVWMYNQGGSPVAHNYGFYLDNDVGYGNWPISSTGTIFATGGSGTAANGWDLSNTTFTGCEYKGVGFCVDGNGDVAVSLGSIATNLKALNITATFNNSGQVFDAPIFENITNTASGSGSLIADLQVGGTTAFSVATNSVVFSNGQFLVNAGGSFEWSGRSQFQSSANGTIKAFANNGSSYSDIWGGNFWSGGNEGVTKGSGCTITAITGGLITGTSGC